MIKKSDLTELKAFPAPPHEVACVVGALSVSLGGKSDWISSKKMLSNTNELIEKCLIYKC